MKDFFTPRRMKILACLMGFALGFIFYVFLSGNAATFPERAFHFAARPFVWAGNNLSNWAKDKADTIASAGKYKAENQMLREQLQGMSASVLEKERLEAENQALRTILNLSETYEGYEWAPPCNVIERIANNLFGNFIINRGSDDGISIGDPVFDETGMIGKISEIGNDYAEVTTILSPDFKINARTINTSESSGRDDAVFGVIENDIEHALKRELLFVCPDRTAPLNIGDRIMTSDDSIYPPGILLGTVKEVFPDDTGLNLCAVLEPQTNVMNINTAFVIRLDGIPEEQGENLG